MLSSTGSGQMSFAQEFIRRLRTWFRRSEPQHPYAYVTAGLKRGPGGRSSAVALEEPEPWIFSKLSGGGFRAAAVDDRNQLR